MLEMDVLKLAQSRRSIRSFSDTEVTRESIDTLLKAAQAAPSAGNCQPWHFFVICDKNVQADISNAAGQHFVRNAPVVLVVCADPTKNEARYGERGRTLYCIQDTAAAIQNILLCAKGLGLGTCWCGAFDEDVVSAVLHLPKDLRPVAIIPVGYPANEPNAPQNRKPLSEIATFI